MFATSKKYKNAVKQLRKFNPSSANKGTIKKIKSSRNIFEYLENLDLLEEHAEETDDGCKKLVRSGIVFNDLPEDTIAIVLAFLPYNTRLAILKHKYHKNYIKSMLQKVPNELLTLSKMWKCAELANKFLESILNYDSDIYTHLEAYSLRSFKGEAAPEKYSGYYKRKFTKIILAAIKHYTKMYTVQVITRVVHYGQFTSYYYSKPSASTKVVEHLEQTILNIFAHLYDLNK